MTETKEIDFEDLKVLTTIEFSVESKMNLDSNESVTIIAHPYVVKQIKIAIAKGKIFSKIYNRIILNEDEHMKYSEMLIIPDSVIEDIIREDIEAEFANNEEVKAKVKALNDKMASISEEELVKISTAKDEDLTAEQLALKNEIQFAMLDAGMNIDLQFNSPKAREEKINNLMNKIEKSDKVAAIEIKGANNE